jgi:DNA-binding MarR family transcriptional regulator
MKMLMPESIKVETSPVLERQLRELIAHFDALSQRLMMNRPPPPGCDVECSPQEMRALGVLGRKGTVIMSDLAGMLSVPLSTTTHTIDKLVAKNLVDRTRPDGDRRVVQVGLSEKGKELHQSFLDFRLDMSRSMLDSLSPGEREIFLELMAKMTQPSKK